MSSQAIGQRFKVSRGGCWQCGSDCRSRLAEALTFSQVAYNDGFRAILRTQQQLIDGEIKFGIMRFPPPKFHITS